MKKTIKILLGLVGIVLLAFILLLVYLMITEYKPKDVEEIAVTGTKDQKLEQDHDYKLLTWNIGYAGLDKDTDFFMDGGKMVFPISKDHVEKALTGIAESIKKIDPDLCLLQEVDSNSKRTYHINEVEFFDNKLDGISTFAYNYKVNFVPIPFPPMGKVNSGIYTNSKYQIESSFRYQQPIPHKWPVRLANLKRGFNASYLPIEGTDKQLVLVNAHLDAYESGSNGRLAQTKQILAFMAEEYKKGNYVIVGGDFNQELREGHKTDTPEDMWHPSPFPYEYMSDDFKTVFDENINSSRLNHKPYDPNDSYECIIDGFIVSKNVTVNKVEGQKLGFVNSDHNPVLLEFKLEKENK
ncbi:endonuclease/exonuclease/phosphatase family protein [uncultured Anaerococcus sp.]|uniref:endonuclease/exonuclease/phosphatase family protein n=1 Tax=uncultured Anaerococcus sp. TaxID=293428 RepID=UPI0025D95569|nr:endonuclease/exonuclease/phosphatase family protein [uncultured Anaerococcus sp.]